MDKLEIAYLVERSIWHDNRERRYRESIESATSEDTEPIVEGDKSGFLHDPHEKLYPCAWNGEKMRPDAKKALKNHVLNAIELEFQQPDKFIYFTVYGSGASYNWDEDGDFDLQMWVDITKFNELHEDDHDLSQDDLVAAIRRIIGPINFISFKDLNLTSDDEDGGEGNMMIQFYAKPGTGSESENLSQKPYACYDMETDEWLVRPKPITPKFYGEAFLLVLPKAEDVAVQAESALDELQRHVTDWQFWYAMWKKYKNHAYKAKFEDARDQAEQFQETVKVLFKGVFGGRQDAYSETGKGIDDERDILQKQLEVWGIFQRLKHWARQPLPWTEQEMPKETRVGWMKRSNWQEIMDNAREIRDSGGVQIQNRMSDPQTGQVHTIGTVESQSEPGSSYETEIWQDDPNSPAITLWSCDCPWGQKSWGRTRQWKKYEGRPCKHTLALYWTALGTPPDDANVQVPQQPAQPQMGEGPQDWVQAPSTPGGANFPTQPLDQPAEIQSDIAALPTPAEQPFSQPQGPPTEDSNSIHFPGALSSWKRADHNGWTNYETWLVKSMIDNNREWLMYAEQLIDRGGIAQDLADWALRTIIGPENQEAMKGAQGWNDKTPWEREEEYPDTHMDYEQDDTPNIIDPELVNWVEIGEHIKQDIENEYRYEHGLPPTWEDEKPDPDAPGDFRLPEGFSSWRKSGSFVNGDIVRCKIPVEGLDRDNITYTIPRNSAGEVLYSDDNSTIVIFPLRKNGPLQSHLVKVEDATTNFYLSPSFNPGPTRR